MAKMNELFNKKYLTQIVNNRVLASNRGNLKFITVFLRKKAKYLRKSFDSISVFHITLWRIRSPQGFRSQLLNIRRTGRPTAFLSFPARPGGERKKFDQAKFKKTPAPAGATTTSFERLPPPRGNGNRDNKVLFPAGGGGSYVLKSLIIAQDER